MKPEKLIQLILLALAGGTLGACGGGGGGGGGSSATSTPSSLTTSSVGTITGFGSVFVNGVEFETDSAQYRVDDKDAFDDSALAVGMRVKIIGSINDDGTTGTADKIIYDDEVEGPIDSGSLKNVDADTTTFSVFGLPVQAHISRTVYDDGATFDTLAEGQVVEVSGYFDGRQVVASRIEQKNKTASRFELKGTVTGYDGNRITVSLMNGSEAGPFDIDAGAELDIPADPVGRFVELKLASQGSGLVAIKIELDDGNLPDDDEDEVHMRGILVDDSGNGFRINGIPVRMDSRTEFSPESLEDTMAAGREVRIEGEMQNGVMLAREIEANDGDIEIEARIIDVSSTSAKSGSMTLDLGNGQTLKVHTDNTTLFRDDSDADLDDDGSFDLTELAAGSDFAEVEAYRNDAGKLIATSVKRRDPGRKTRLKAPLESFEHGDSVTMLGIDFTVGSGTDFEVEGLGMTDALKFFDSLQIGDTMKVKDRDADGTADEMELDN